MTAIVKLPRILRIGGGARHDLPTALRELGLTRPLLICDAFMESQGHLQALLDGLSAARIEATVFTDVVPDPTTDSVMAALKALQSAVHDAVIGFGGGSAMDTAKLCAALAGREGAISDYKVPHTLDDGLPVIAIPTTAGTGSEVTQAAVVTDSDTDEKMLCMGLALVPMAALVDYELTLTMPYRLTADTGIDTLCHALEAYVSRKANPFTDTLALSVMGDVATHLRTACEQPDDRKAREVMMLAATRGGMAFSNASVTLIHGMSRPIGAHFHVPHGLSNAMLLPTVTAWSVEGAPERYAACARAMSMATEADSDSVATGKLVDGLHRLCADLAVPSPAEFGIVEKHWTELMPTMAEQALASGSPNNNPRLATAGEIEALYQQVWQSASAWRAGS